MREIKVNLLAAAFLLLAGQARAEEDTRQKLGRPDLEAAETPCLTQSENTKDLSIRSGDSIWKLLLRAGVSKKEVGNAIKSLKKGRVLSDLQPGQNLRVLVNEKKLGWVRYRPSIATAYCASKSGGFKWAPLELPTTVEQSTLQMAITHNVLTTVTAHEEGPALAYQLDALFKPLVGRLKRGATIRVFFEKRMIEGELLNYGQILAAEYKFEDQKHRAFLFQDNYYDDLGNPLTQTAFKPPVPFAQLTSPFGWRRHPIRRRRRFHRGIDYGAQHGTPVFAAKDGVVAFARRKGHFGKMIAIDHEGKLRTRYAHLSRYASGIRGGKKVKAGDLIGFVGATGLTTGAHLHFETLVGKEHVDPALLQRSTAPFLTAAQERDFLYERKSLLETLGEDEPEL